MLSTTSTYHLLRKRVACSIARRNITSAQKRALKRKQASTQSETTISNQPPTSTIGNKNIPKAPHMQSQVFEATSAGKKNGVIDSLKANPLVFAIFVFPTMMMGVALIIRPDFRAQILGGVDNDDAKERSNASINVPKDAPAPAYEESSTVADRKEVTKEEEEVVDTIPNIDNLQQDVSVQEDVSSETKHGEVQDLLYALGIRPHQSLTK